MESRLLLSGTVGFLKNIRRTVMLRNSPKNDRLDKLLERGV
jgi:hypothetical protein